MFCWEIDREREGERERERETESDLSLPSLSLRELKRLYEGRSGTMDSNEVGKAVHTITFITLL